MVIVGGEDAWMATDILKNNNIPVVIKRTQALPSRADEDIDLPFKLPSLLQKAGILYCITLGDGSDGFWDQRNLPFHAGQAVPNGLTEEQAIAAITSNPAKILGIADQTGTLEAGKDANIIVSTGDVLDMRNKPHRNTHLFKVVRLIWTTSRRHCIASLWRNTDWRSRE